MLHAKLEFGACSEVKHPYELQMATRKPVSEATGGASFAIAPPIAPMLAKLSDALPEGDGFLFEPKWDGFRAIVFRGASDV